MGANWIRSLNLYRRQLTPSQKAAVALEMMPLLEAEAKERQRAAGGDRKSEEYQRSVLANPSEPVSPAPTTRKQVADIMGISEKRVQDVINIAKAAPEKVEQIKKGEVTVKEELEGPDLQLEVPALVVQ